MEQTMDKARILLADDHKMFRQGLRELIERKTGFEVVGEASSGREVLAQVEALRPDIVLLDIQMPELDGVAVARQLARTHPEVKIVILTMYRQDQHLFEAINAGARAYLLKDADAEELLDVLGRVQRGEAALDPAITARGFDEIRRLNAAQESGEQLTPREREVLDLRRGIQRLLHVDDDNRALRREARDGRGTDAGTAAGDDVDGAGRVGHVEVSLREARAARAGEWPRMVLSPRVVVDRRRAWESGPETFGRG